MEEVLKNVWNIFSTYYLISFNRLSYLSCRLFLLYTRRVWPTSMDGGSAVKRQERFTPQITLALYGQASRVISTG